MKFFQKFTRLKILFLFFPLSSQFILYVAKGILHTSIVYIHFNFLSRFFLTFSSLLLLNAQKSQNSFGTAITLRKILYVHNYVNKDLFYTIFANMYIVQGVLYVGDTM